MRNSGIPQDFELAGSGILQKTAVVLFGNPEMFRYPIQCRSWGGGGGGGGDVEIFWNSPLHQTSWKVQQLATPI